MADIAKVHANMAGWYPDIITDLAEITPSRAFCSYGPLGMGAGEVLIADVIEVISEVRHHLGIQYRVDTRKLFSGSNNEIIDPPRDTVFTVLTTDHTIMESYKLYASPFLIPYTGTNPERIYAFHPFDEPTK